MATATRVTVRAQRAGDTPPAPAANIVTQNARVATEVRAPPGCATRFCATSWGTARRDHGLGNDARSISRTASRSAGRIGSIRIADMLAPLPGELGFGGSDVAGNERGGVSRLPAG